MTEIIALLLLVNLLLTTKLIRRSKELEQKIESLRPVSRQLDGGSTRRFGMSTAVERARTSSPRPDGDRPPTGRMSRMRMGDSYGHANDGELHPN